MITNPYKILDVSPNASNEEIKKAYRELSRKYHPDSYVNNPLSELAEEKFKEVQEAYSQIMQERENGYSGVNSSANNETDEMRMVFNYINVGNYMEALKTLSRIPLRNGRWYYYSAVANAGVGNNVMAFDHARQAVNMEPDNQEYRDFLNHMQSQGQRYQDNRYGGYGTYGGGGVGGGYGRGCGTGNLCCDLWCADSCCECMGGDIIPCI